MVSGTSPVTIFWDSPSTMAVLPTPGSPIRTGLFLVRRDSTCMTRSISRSRPMTGSSLRSRASWVRLRPNWSSTGEPLGASWPPAGPAPAGGAFLATRRLVARQELDHLLAHPGQVGAEADQHLGGHALALAHQAQEHVLGADVVVAELQGLAQRQLQDLLGPGRERRGTGGRRTGRADGLLDLLPHRLQADPERLERLGRHALTLVDEAQQDVLSADEVVVEQSRFFLGQDQDSSGSVSETFEHARPPCL